MILKAKISPSNTRLEIFKSIAPLFNLYKLKYFAIICVFTITYSSPLILFSQGVNVTVGADILISDSLHLIQDKKLGIVTNHSAVLSNGVHLV
ncbi:MAG: hypothetical protein KAI45_05475, partial [Melioribacteraceae bacterium]|nr:hypothetical protein [Melioribacteraceae bacterium]